MQAADAQHKALEGAAARARQETGLSEPEDGRLAELAKELAKMAKATAGQQAKVDAADAKIAGLQEQVDAIGGVRLRAQKSK
eukprot:2547138-Prymnesium_polylepis.1